MLHKIANEAEVEEGDRIVVEIEGIEIALFKFNSSYHLLANYCVHQGGPLCEGDVSEGIMLSPNLEKGEDHAFWNFDPDKKTISCPWHKWRFDVESGENVNDNRYKVPKYDAVVRNGEIFVDL